MILLSYGMLKNLFKLARPTQWLKNGVLLAPLVFAGEMSHTLKIELAFAAVAVFCLLSSAVYTFNDLIDRNYDRQHPLKKERPLAAGKVTPTQAVVMILILLVIALLAAWLINRNFFIIALVFIGLNLVYSLFLKDIVILDAMSVGLSFVLRAYAGALAINVTASTWLLINTLLLALFLSFGKRRHELVLLEEGAIAHRKILGHYSPYLLDQMIGVTTASVVVMYMLYTFSSEVSEKLGTDNLYLTIPFVVYGIFRYLYLIHKKEKGGSPTTVLITDLPIMLTVLLWVLTSILILYYA
ncbi:MAG: decaprenyl-phosphate phosphoribosyltransferase [candidate division Zixibacteria bacterium]|nr:decaprenyl-phosphate phosphoribosyltransferase [candidate division Zixibacteria bacterium]